MCVLHGLFVEERPICSMCLVEFCFLSFTIFPVLDVVRAMSLTCPLPYALLQNAGRKRMVMELGEADGIAPIFDVYIV